MDLGQIEQLLDWLRFLADNWWLVAVAGGLVLLVVLIKNAKAILHTLAVAIGIGIVLVVVVAIIGTPGAATAPTPVLASSPAPASSPLAFLGAGACLGAVLLAAAAVAGAVLYRRFFGAKQGGKWLPGPNALWGRSPYSQDTLPFYVINDEGDEIANLILSDPDLWGLSAPPQEYREVDWG
ncbi:MAG: hypothetical protein JW900_12525 [Anaerolineae bacterium]|nr:hypothetical protein [Anaerolineae bacterium]